MMKLMIYVVFVKTKDVWHAFLKVFVKFVDNNTIIKE